MSAAVWGMLGAALVLRALALSPYEIGYSDEYMQYLEQGRRLATGHGIIPWEYRYGARNALIPQIMALPQWLGLWWAPGTHLALWLARGLFAALASAGTLWGAWALGRATSARHGLVALAAAGLWWESILFCDLMLSESIGASLCLAAAALLTGQRRPGRLALAGLLLGLGVMARLQYGLFAAVLALWALWGADRRAWGAVVAGGLGAGLIGALSDVAMGQTPFRWIAVNLAMNIDAGRAARFGTEPAAYYLRLMLAHWGMAAPFLLAGAVFAASGAQGRRYRPLLAAALVSLAAHSLIAHKEYRFVWVSVLALVVLGGIGALRWAEQRWPRNPRAVVAALVAGLGALSWVAAQQSGGFASMRGGAAITTLAVQA
ncbi:MAG TPA: hypothetical protein VN222_15300, partial [Novosphingobium sp.]|nr:hypothetical protein [Novosphingobium sp.]